MTGMRWFGLDLTKRGAGKGIDYVCEAETVAEAIALAESAHPGFHVIRGQSLTEADQWWIDRQLAHQEAGRG